MHTVGCTCTQNSPESKGFQVLHCNDLVTNEFLNVRKTKCLEEKAILGPLLKQKAAASELLKLLPQINEIQSQLLNKVLMQALWDPRA